MRVEYDRMDVCARFCSTKITERYILSRTRRAEWYGKYGSGGGGEGGRRERKGFPPDFNNISEFFFFFFLALATLIGDSLCDIFIIIFLVFFSPPPPSLSWPTEPFPIIPKYCALFESDL